MHWTSGAFYTALTVLIQINRFLLHDLNHLNLGRDYVQFFFDFDEKGLFGTFALFIAQINE